MIALRNGSLRVEARLALVEDARVGREPAWVIEQALGDDCDPVRELATVAAAEVLRPERLVALIHAGESATRRSAAMAALVLAGERAVEAVLAAARERPPGTAIFFLQVLGHLGGPEALRALEEATGDDNLLVVQAALEALGQRRDPASLPVLVRALDREPWLAWTAVAALGELGDARAVGPLEALRARDPTFTEAIEEALGRIRAAGRAPDV